MHEGLSAAVTGLHSMTGTDFTSAFFEKGKKRPWSVLLKNLEYVEWFISLGLPEDPDETKCEEFVLLLYSLENSTDVNSARYNKLCQMAGLKKTGKQKQLGRSQLKKVDCFLLPPPVKTF